MAILEKAIETLAQAERVLRALVGQAAADGEYDAVARLTEGARAIGAIARSWENGNPTESNPNPRGKEPISTPHRAVRLRDEGAKADKQDRVRARGRRSKRPPARGEYPKFFRRGDDLVKIGWSKKQREEYVHKAPRRVIDALAAAITRHAGNGKLFAAEELFTRDRSLKDPTTGEELPGYQAYVALAWFKSAGLVNQHGRQGYSAGNGSHLANVVATAWGRLSDHVAH